MQQRPSPGRYCTEARRETKGAIIKTDKRMGSELQYPATVTQNIQEAMRTSAKKYDKNTPHEPYKEVLAFPETDKVSLFKNKI